MFFEAKWLMLVWLLWMNRAVKYPHNSHFRQIAVVGLILSVATGATGSCSADEAFRFRNGDVHWTCLPSGYLAPHVDDNEAFIAQARDASREELVALLKDANRFVAAHFALCMSTGTSPAPHPVVVSHVGYEGRVGPIVVRIALDPGSPLVHQKVEYTVKPQNLQSLQTYWQTRLADVEVEGPGRAAFYDELKYTSISERIARIEDNPARRGTDAKYCRELFARGILPEVHGFHALRARIEPDDVEAAKWLLANDRRILQEIMNEDACFCRLHLALSELLAPEAVAYLGEEVMLNGLTLSVDAKDHPNLVFSFPNLSRERPSLRRFWSYQMEQSLETSLNAGPQN